MKFLKSPSRTPVLIQDLTEVWRASVRATHLFLSPQEIQEIEVYVPSALEQVPHLVVAEENGRPVGFMGIDGDRLEMLFLHPQYRGQSLGRQLLQMAFAEYGVQTVCVNEQNPQAVGFYTHMGFHTVRRSALDEQGRPYPLLYMER